jgi:hypothetical protein
MVLIVNLHHSRICCFCPKFKKWCRGHRSRALLVLVPHRWLVVVLAMEVPSAGGAPQDATGVEVVDADPRLGDSARSFL